MSRNQEKDATADQVRGSALLLVGRGLSVGLNFLTQVITVRYLVKEDYGALAYALAMASFFGNVSRMGMDKAVSRIAAIQEEHREYAHMFGTLIFAVAAVVLCGSAISGGVVVLEDTLGTKVVTDELSLNLLLILIALAPIQALDHLMQSVFAIFSKPRLIFFRKYVVGPCLKLAAVLWVLVAAGDARDLAIAHLVAGFLGLAIGLSLAGRVLRERDLLARFRWRAVRVSVRRVLGYGLPMLGSDVVLLLRGALVVFLLEFAHGSAAVADFRAVLPVARLNNVALESFVFLFIPAVARLTATRNPGALNDMYWRSATWVTILSLPIFLVTFCLARPVTVLLFSERYAGAAIVLAILSVGAFVNAVLSMSGHALKAAGRVRDVLIVDGAALILGLTLALTLVPRYGAVGGAIAVAVAGVVHGVAYHLVLTLTLDVRMLPYGLGRVYGAVGVVAGGVLAFDTLVAPPVWVHAPVVAVAWLSVLVGVASHLQVERTFPELLRIPVIGKLIQRALSTGTDSTEDEDATRQICDALEASDGSLREDVGAPPYRAEVKRTSRRPGSTIVECEVNGSAGRLPVLVKAIEADEEDIVRALSTEPDFPRLGMREHPAVILDRERVALQAIHEHFDSLDDTRFQSIRVLDVFSEDGIVAMERLPHPTLHNLLQRQSFRPWGGASKRLVTASENAGAWLKTFHAMPALEHTERRHATMSSYFATLRELTTYIRQRRGDDPVLEWLTADVTAAGRILLSGDLPLGLAHGDYAPRNILVGPDGRVAVIDTPGRWLSVKYLDLGYFLANLWTLGPTAVSRGLIPGTAILESVERALLRGYFQDEIGELPKVRIYEVLTLLARWASMIHGGEQRRNRGLVRQFLYGARERHIRRRLQRCIEDINQSAIIQDHATPPPSSAPTGS